MLNYFHKVMRNLNGFLPFHEDKSKKDSQNECDADGRSVDELKFRAMFYLGFTTTVSILIHGIQQYNHNNRERECSKQLDHFLTQHQREMQL